MRTGEVTVRVRVVSHTQTVELAGAQRLRVGPVTSGRRRSRSLVPPVTVRLTGSRYVVRDGKGRSRSYSSNSPLQFDTASHTLTVDSVAYLGAIVLSANSDNTFDVVEHVSIEQYLPGVLSRELYPGWSETTYEAQAIAARSYALNERQRRLALGSSFDLQSTTRDQEYGGADASDRAKRAVRRTRGIVLTYQNAILRAYYSSTCGGRPASARDTWPISSGFEFNLAAPIQGVPHDCPDEFSPRYRWTVQRSTNTLVARLRAFGAARGMKIRSLTSLRSIRQTRRNPAQRPATYTITDRQGASWRISAESLRLAFNHDGSSGLGKPAKDSKVWSGDMEIRIDGDVVTINGRGYGHGVGLCQFGAEGLARKGASARSILKHYYTGAELKVLY